MRRAESELGARRSGFLAVFPDPGDREGMAAGSHESSSSFRELNVAAVGRGCLALCRLVTSGGESNFEGIKSYNYHRRRLACAAPAFRISEEMEQDGANQ